MLAPFSSNSRRSQLPSIQRLALPLLTTTAGLAALLTTDGAQAQQTVDHGTSIQRFQAAPGPRNSFTMRGARTDGEKVWSAGLMINYAWQPLTVVRCVSQSECDSDGGKDVKVVENLLTGDFLGSFTIIPRVQLGLRVPVQWLKGVGITET